MHSCHGGRCGCRGGGFFAASLPGLRLGLSGLRLRCRPCLVRSCPILTRLLRFTLRGRPTRALAPQLAMHRRGSCPRLLQLLRRRPFPLHRLALAPPPLVCDGILQGAQPLRQRRRLFRRHPQPLARLRRLGCALDRAVHRLGRSLRLRAQLRVRRLQLRSQPALRRAGPRRRRRGLRRVFLRGAQLLGQGRRTDLRRRARAGLFRLLRLGHTQSLRAVRRRSPLRLQRCLRHLQSPGEARRLRSQLHPALPLSRRRSLQRAHAEAQRLCTLLGNLRPACCLRPLRLCHPHPHLRRRCGSARGSSRPCSCGCLGLGDAQPVADGRSLAPLFRQLDRYHPQPLVDAGALASLLRRLRLRHTQSQSDGLDLALLFGRDCLCRPQPVAYASSPAGFLRRLVLCRLEPPTHLVRPASLLLSLRPSRAQLLGDGFGVASLLRCLRLRHLHPL